MKKTKIVVSLERSTGRGADKYTAILIRRGFARVGDLRKALYLGREKGVDKYQVEVPFDTVVGEFYRSNSGKEDVNITSGAQVGVNFRSFDAAQEWGRKRNEQKN